uniref:Uncharacterized protein n=2 Tax=Meloidogyne enterolobii TaxID=390850 RepID=A0A6V7W2T9_MELEN|nr:unnamed protein product [Meloidogyne enterolobii]
MLKTILFSLIFFLFIFKFIFGLEKIRKCSCVEQYNCFDNMKEDVGECFDECIDRAGLETEVNEANCMPMRKRILYSYYSCIHSETSMNQSCAWTSDEQKVEFRDFDAIFLRLIRPIADREYQHLELLSYGTDLPFVRRTISIEKCSRECGMKKLKNLLCFSQRRCGLYVNEFGLGEIMEKCEQQMNLKDRFAEVCDCFTKSGASELAPFCAKIRTKQFP